MCARKVNVIAPHPTPPPPPHPTKPLRALSKNENLRGVQAKLLYVKNFTGSPVTPPPLIRPAISGGGYVTGGVGWPAMIQGFFEKDFFYEPFGQILVFFLEKAHKVQLYNSRVFLFETCFFFQIWEFKICGCFFIKLWWSKKKVVNLYIDGFVLSQKGCYFNILDLTREFLESRKKYDKHIFSFKYP